MRKKILLISSGLCLSIVASAQLYIDNSTLHLESGAVLTVQGMDVISNSNISGTGKVLMKSTTSQNINMNNGGAATNYNSVPMLEIDATNGVSLTGNTGVTQGVTFTNGKLTAGAYDLYVDRDATFTSASSTKYIVTNDTGMVHKKIASTATPTTGYQIPLGTSTNYMPATLTHTGGTYSNAILSVAAKDTKPTEVPTIAVSYLNAYWPLEVTGATAGTFNAKGVYPTSLVTGTESNIYGYTYNTPGWNLGTVANTTEHSVAANMTGLKGYLTGYNQTLVVNAKVFLQGSMSGTSMRKSLNSTATLTCLIPKLQPYNVAPWNYTGTESVTTVPANATDWVLVELRNATTPSTIIAKRAGFVLTDGTIVDIDGVSPITFNNAEGNYHVAIKHRNHLPIRTSSAQALSLNSTLYDFTNAQSKAYQNTSIATNAAMRDNGNGTFSMWGGNGAQTVTLGENSLRTLGAPNVNDLSLILTNLGTNTAVLEIYSPVDYNMDRNVRSLGSPTVNDFTFLSTNIGTTVTKTAHQ